MTAMTKLELDDWMDRDNAVQRHWAGVGTPPARQSDPLARLLGFRTDGVRAAGEVARQNGRKLRVVRYVQAPEHEAGPQFEALELVAQSRHFQVRSELCLDPAGPALLEYRPGLAAARCLLRAGFADGLVAPTYEHISPDLREYERFLKAMAERGWFVALALSETGR
ncbi:MULTISPECIES: hypothetical protein [unclassified Streptomyces]|uniref:hypothetical protein n=1 Tax=unclassified Streptomyces TaxID=2593676 RepID=UPI001BE4F02A|nr:MULTISPECIES: hypothetical protein [unclassified Streptomyces]MBT2402018.1 hypothetical protein [Streptomyces sp. ISL-21]MBT2454265.1 hypothetical protein [Streptomyces sp. ISL-86]MBT2609472.1 hypothetical protein [Streptomyces sp. ISL-87]